MRGPSLLASNKQTLALLAVRRCRALRLPEAPVPPTPDWGLSFELAQPPQDFHFCRNQNDVVAFILRTVNGLRGVLKFADEDAVHNDRATHSEIDFNRSNTAATH